MLEAARMKLADVVMNLARDPSLTPEQLTEAALKEMFADPTAL